MVAVSYVVQVFERRGERVIVGARLPCGDHVEASQKAVEVADTFGGAAVLGITRDDDVVRSMFVVETIGAAPEGWVEAVFRELVPARAAPAIAPEWPI